MQLKRSFSLVLAAVILAACSGSAGTTATPSAATPAASGSSGLVDIGAGLQGPTGLAATVFATGLPDVAAFALDAEGRLWVATAAFEDAGTDAVYRVDRAGTTPVRVIAGLHTPLGLLWLGDDLYVASEGGVVAWSGLAGDAFTSHRTILALPDGSGEVNGLARSPDGRLVLGISAPCDACTPSSTDSAAVVAFLPDGTDLRVVAEGIRAPVGLTYGPGGELFVTMNQRDDLGEATPGDWLSIVEAGQHWGFPDCYGQDTAACAGAPSPVAVLDPHAAVSGVAVVDRFGAITGGSAFVAEWAKGVVLRVALATDASGTTSGTVHPFLAGFQSPVAVVAAADGALLVGDWGSGTVYRIAPA